MIARRMIAFWTALSVLLVAMMSTPAVAQGYGGLGTKAEGFSVPQRGTPFDFPGDHGAHPDFRIEWWYVTANLTGEDGRDYGVQWTLFRSALRPSAETPQSGSVWTGNQVWMAHAAVTTPQAHYFAETRARNLPTLAGVETAPFNAHIHDWHLRAAPGNTDGIGDLVMRASGEDFTYQLTLQTGKPLIFHGDRGYSVKSAGGQASYYYSQPFYQVAGVLNLPDGPVKVTGTAWLDREWSSQPLSEDQQGWDWVSLHLESGDKLMGFRLRQADGSHFTSATWIAADGKTEAFGNGALQMTPLRQAQVAGRQVPVAWQVVLPAKSLDLKVEALNDDTWMGTSFPYWEGPVRLQGSHGGRGYLEMTGYQ